jgi:hypothetical protein
MAHLIDDSGYCPAHRDGGREHMADLGSRGGQATRAKLAGHAFTAEDLPPLHSIEDAKAALDVIRVAVMTRRLTHAEGNAASKATAEWIKGETAAITARLNTELRTELDAKQTKIEALEKQVATFTRERR